MASMTEMFPLERMLNQLTELYQQILLNQDKNMTLDPQTTEALQRLSREIEEMSQHTEMEAARMGVSPELIKQTILGPQNHLPKDIQNILEKSQQLKGQIEGCRNVLKTIMKKQKEEKKAGKNTSKKRKDKFKKLGGKDGWIPS
jgi:hypothetical protein